MGPRVLQRVWLLGLATAGVITGHVLAYGLEFPDHVHRDDYLASTGHGYWPLAVTAALTAGLLAAAVVAATRLRARAMGARTEPIAVGRLVPMLATIQILLYAGLEIVESLVSGTPLTALLDGSLLVNGLVSQVLVAAIAALLVAWLARLVERTVLAEGRPEWQRPLEVVSPPAPGLRASRVSFRPLGARAPPS